jgi:hypothetical protein
MGLTDSLLLKLAQGIFGSTIKSVNDLSSDQKKAVEAAYKQGMADAENKKEKTELKSSQSTITVSDTPAEKSAGALDFSGIASDLGEGLGRATAPFTSLETVKNDVNALIIESQKLADTMGLGRARAGELKSTIADTLPEMVKLGMTTDESIKVITDIPNALKTNASIANETIVELGATSKFAGVDVGSLVKEFSSVGTQLSSVGDEMADVANYAKSVGVNVKEVTAGVVGNLKQLNLFNFENGVQGLAKMQAQSAMLGVNMEKVFAKADSLLNPESAIEFTSALQRLGVTSTELLDPLSAMDMALNDPAKLQDEMTKVAQQFTRLKADGTGFEILPGAKLQLREVAKELGMSADELAGMAIKSSDLDMKLKQIRFPSFAASEEDRMLIANMSQMKDGRAVVQITDETGEKKEVAVEDLTANQLEELKKEQANQNKSAEEIARDQLSVQERIEGILKGTELSARMGVASSGTLQRAAEANLAIRESAMENLYGKVKTKDVRGAVTDITSPVESSIVSLFTEGGLSSENITRISDTLNDIPKNLMNRVFGLTMGALEGAESGIKQGAARVSGIYGGIGGLQPITESEVSTSYITQIKEFVSKATTLLETKTDQNFNVQQKIDITNSDGSLKNAPPELYNVIIDKLKNDPKNLLELDAGIKKVTSGI